ncbi:unnamed protein product, partial [Brenthis ino]
MTDSVPHAGHSRAVGGTWTRVTVCRVVGTGAGGAGRARARLRRLRLCAAALRALRRVARLRHRVRPLDHAAMTPPPPPRPRDAPQHCRDGVESAHAQAEACRATASDPPYALLMTFCMEISNVTPPRLVRRGGSGSHAIAATTRRR